MGIVRGLMALLMMVSIMAMYTYGEAMVPNQESQELLEIIETMEEKEIDVENWKIYTRDTLQMMTNEQGVEDQFQELLEITEGFQWTEKTSGETDKYVGSKQHPKKNIIETVTFLAYPHKTNFQTYLIYEVNGDGWDNQEWQSFSPILSDRIETFFDNNSPIFTTVTGSGNNNPNLGLDHYANKLVDSFSAQKIEGLNEETFVSLSAYNDQWETSIQSKQEKINLQIALRGNERLGGGITVTIGTPIITSEY